MTYLYEVPEPKYREPVEAAWAEPEPKYKNPEVPMLLVPELMERKNKNKWKWS